jgi:uncharacterized Ntn-hydrolase superfamily protein
MTFSAVARDPKTGDLGVAVQSHWFSVGAICPWAEAGVGAVATQSLVLVSYGPAGLERMRKGEAAQEALAALLAADDGREVRQVAMVDSAGRVAAHSGSKCIACAGHATGEGWSVQANMMKSDRVVPAMARAISKSKGDLAERLMVTLEAAQRAGGDIRGKQSAAMIVVEGERTAKQWEGKLVDLRVEDHKEPLVELRRLLSLQRAYAHMNAGDEALERKDSDGAMREYAAAERLSRANPEIEFWSALTLAKSGKVREALPRLRRVVAKDRNWLELMRRLPAAGIASDAQISALARALSKRR